MIGVNDILTAIHVLYNLDHGGWASQLAVYPEADCKEIAGKLEDAPYSIGVDKWQANRWPSPHA